MNRMMFLMLLALLGACASAPVAIHPGLPDWVAHPEKLLPRERYLVSVGSGKTREDAIQDAKKQMAEVFQTKVQTLTRVRSDSSLRQNTEGSQAGESAHAVSKEMTFESNVRLRGAEVKEVAVADGATHVLLALDKLAARSAILAEAAQVRARLSGLLDSLESDHQVSKWEQVKLDQTRLSDLSGEATVLGLGALMDTTALDERFRRIESELRSKNEKKVFLVRSIKGDEEFARGLEICIQDQGASVSATEGSNETVNQVLVSVVEHPQHLAVEGWVKIRYEVTANIVSPNGRSYRISEQRSETSRSREAGLESAAAEIAKVLCQKLWNRVSEMK
jgi:hypothetical protein